MLNKIVANINKTSRDVLLIDVLMNHIFNQMLKDKWVFTMNTYHNLLENINLVKDGNSDNIVRNYIINDYETLSQMLQEFKEDIYPVFNSQIFMLLDSFTYQELLELVRYQRNILSKFHSYSTCIQNILSSDIYDIREFSKKLSEDSIIDIAENDLKFIPLNQLNEIIKTSYLSISQYIYIYQIFTKTLKYFKDKTKYLTQYNKFRFNTLIMMMGDKNV